jgi:hypothetical protein
MENFQDWIRRRSHRRRPGTGTDAGSEARSDLRHIPTAAARFGSPS